MRISTILTGLLVLGCNPVGPQQEVPKTSVKLLATVYENEDCLSITKLEFKASAGSSMALSDQNPFSGKACSYFSSGKIHTMTTFRNGLKQGKWLVCYENGQIEKEGNIDNGKEHGTYFEYFSNGQLKYNYTYDSCKKTGIWKSWYENGTKYTERHFQNDQLHGKVLVWDENGKLAKEYHYDHGTLVNSLMHFKTED